MEVDTSESVRIDRKKKKLDKQKYSKCDKFDINKSISYRGRSRLMNDYNQHFLDTGLRPQNFIRDSDFSKRFEEYPKLDRLMKLKSEIIQARATPPMYIKANLRTFNWDSLGVRFDVILINPPWHNSHSLPTDKFCWTVAELKKIPIDRIADSPSFCFIWCGADHLEDARETLSHWKFRRCEDICWLKTNIHWKNSFHDNSNFSRCINNDTLLKRTTEHCLVGVNGIVKRDVDFHFIHSNLDTDVLIAEETDPLELLLREYEMDDLRKQLNDTNMEQIHEEINRLRMKEYEKPKELYDIIDRFCMGRRKLELFGIETSIRPGWLTIGPYLSSSNFDPINYRLWTEGDACWPEKRDYRGGRFMGTTDEIENLRPKSPPRAGGASNVRYEEYSD
ncbi:MT-A70 [Babesia microti strain RI]|uniref:MT-A70 n=1 Tax=Babesia microti (strain RI) TaxID=1133968 RepID=I7J9P5_BABMR|nr:MT-A70 [Babesia microti strain RI]CCF73414.1 MT-A70 [Babesia microti strain RI]|eukprot:XP_012648023.1 MT-A70 [Babesia microti strain RI]